MKPNYHPELYERLMRAYEDRDNAAMSSVAAEVSKMPAWEVFLFAVQVARCPEREDVAMFVAGMLTGELKKIGSKR